MGEWLGEFEQMVLFAVAQVEDAYGATIRDEIEQRTGRQVSAGAIYTTLDRLEARGLLTSRWGDPTPERGGKRKRHFTLKPAGREALERSWQAIRAMARGFDPKVVKP